MLGKYSDKSMDEILHINNIVQEKQNDYKTAFALMQHNLKELNEKYDTKTLYKKLSTFPEYIEKEKAIYSNTSEDKNYFNELRELQHTYIPELKAYNYEFKKLIEVFDCEFPIEKSKSNTNENIMNLAKTYGKIMGESYQTLMENTEFQEKIKKLSMIYDPIKQSIEYMEAYNNLMYLYVPDMKQAREAFKN